MKTTASDRKHGDELVPGALPIAPPPGARPLHLGLIFGMIGLWLAPLRAGAHLGPGRRRTAVLAGIVGALGSVWLWSSVAAGDTFRRDGGATFWERVRLGPAGMIVAATEQLTDWDVFVRIVILAPCQWAFGVVLLACALVPWADHGEPFRALFDRAVKTACWLLTLGIPTGMVILLAQHHHTFEPVLFQVAGAFAVGVWVVWVALRAFFRYAGPAEGPGWEPQPPLCVACGYTLTALDFDQVCPECARPIADSMVARRPIPWQRASGLLGRARAFPSAVRRICQGRRFFERLPTQSHPEAGRCFFLWNWILLSAAASALVLLVDCGIRFAGLRGSMFPNVRVVAQTVAAITVSVLVGQGLILSFVFWTNLRHRPRLGGASFYLVGLLWPAAVAGYAITAAGTVAHSYWRGRHLGPIDIAGVTIDMTRDVLIVVAGLTFQAIILVWIVVRVRAACRAARYANA